MKNYLRFVYAILAVPLAVLLRYAIIPLVGPGVPYVTLFPVSVGVALLAGLGPAILTGILGSIVIDYLFIPPLYEIEFTTLEGFSRMAIVVLTSVFVGYVGEVLRAARRKAEEQASALRDSQQDLNHAQAVAHSGSWRLDVRQNKLTWSDEVYRIFGVPTGTALTYESFLSYIHPDDREYVDTKWQAALGGEKYDIEHRIIVRDTIKWVRERAELEFDPQGVLLGGFGTVTDITSRKKMEEALRQAKDELEQRIEERTAQLKSERQRFYDVLETLPAYVCLLTPDYRMPFANRVFREWFGYEPDKKCYEFLFNRTEPCESCETYSVLKTGKPHRWEWTGPNGRNYDIYDFPFTDTDGSPLIMEMGIDITEQKQAEKQLRNRAHQQALVAELSWAAISQADISLLFDKAVNSVADSLGVEYAKVLELLPDGSKLLLRSGVGWKEGLVGLATVGAGTDSQAGYTLLSSEPVVVKDLRTEKRFSGPPLLHEHGVVSGMSVIIGGKDKPFGVLGTHTKKTREFTRDDVLFLQSVANVLAAAIEQKQAQEQLRLSSLYTRGLIEASLDPLLTISTDGKIMDVNEATIRVTGVAREQLIGDDFSDYFTEPEKAREGYKEVFAKGFVTDYPLTIRHKDGRLTNVLYNATVYRDIHGNIMGVFAAARDITEKKAAEAELEKYRLHLEELVRQRTEELARSNKDLEQFAYVASHDLQEPLRAVAGFVELLRQQLPEPLDAKKQGYMNFIIEAVKRMQSLINGLLEYSRIETRGKKPEPTDAGRALNIAVMALQTSIQESGAKIIAETLPTVNVDSVQMVQLFQNLIGNAIKFRSESSPEIRISATRDENNWRFAVADNGIGIEPQYAQRIFLIFQRLHTREKYPGTGIGLAVCKKIVEHHGGKIWVESKPGQGSTFYFTIPRTGDI